jgi:general secretion pathway protein L
VSQEPGPVALVDIGATKTNLCIVSGGKPRVMRTLGHGGNTVTRAIGEALGVSFSEAEQKKLSFTGTDPGDGHEEDGKIAETAQQVLKTLAQGIYQTLHSYETTSGEPITTLYLSGGGARLAGLDDFFARALGRNIRRWKVPPAMEAGFSDCPGAVDLAMPGLGLALRGIRKDRDAGFNFRKGEFFATKEVQEIRGRLLTFTGLLLAVILLGGLDFYSRLQDRESQFRQVKQEIRKVYLETFPGSQTIVDENQQIKTAVSELKKKVAALGGNVSDEVSPMDLLKEITDKLPPDVQVEIQDFMIDRGHVRIQGVTSSFDAADRVKKELEGIPYFHKVEITDAKLSADQKKVNFRISAEL